MYSLCRISDIPINESRGFTSNQKSFFIINKDGQFYAYINSCPHIGIELNWEENQFLDIEGALIQCSTHGALFLIENGQCVAGPCIGKALQSIPIRVIDEHIYIVDTTFEESRAGNLV